MVQGRPSFGNNDSLGLEYFDSFIARLLPAGDFFNSLSQEPTLTDATQDLSTTRRGPA